MVYTKIETKLSLSIKQDVVYHEKQKDDNVANCIGVISVEYNAKLWRSNKQFAIYEEDETGQQCDRSYRLTLCQKWNWTIMNDLMG